MTAPPSDGPSIMEEPNYLHTIGRLAEGKGVAMWPSKTEDGKDCMAKWPYINAPLQHQLATHSSRKVRACAAIRAQIAGRDDDPLAVTP
jgi:hypothetical protein